MEKIFLNNEFFDFLKAVNDAKGVEGLKQILPADVAEMLANKIDDTPDLKLETLLNDGTAIGKDEICVNLNGAIFCFYKKTTDINNNTLVILGIAIIAILLLKK